MAHDDRTILPLAGDVSLPMFPPNRHPEHSRRNPEDAYPTHTVRTLSTTEARTWRTRHGFPGAENITYRRANPVLGLEWSKSSEPHRLDKHPRGPSAPRHEALFHVTNL
jgi:hypothetical protein